MRKLCAECKTPITYGKFTPRTKKKYCSLLCQKRVNERVNYHRNKKNNPAFIKKNRERRREWHNDHIRLGLCTRCIKKAPDGYKLCDECYLELKGL